MQLKDISHPDAGVEKACRRYARGLMKGTNQSRRDGNIREQVQRYQDYIVGAEFLRLRVTAVLDKADVPSYFRVLYLDFARRVDKVMRKFDKRTRLYLAHEAVARWLDYGCRQEVMCEICRTALSFDIEKETAALRQGD